MRAPATSARNLTFSAVSVRHRSTARASAPPISPDSVRARCGRRGRPGGQADQDRCRRRRGPSQQAESEVGPVECRCRGHKVRGSRGIPMTPAPGAARRVRRGSAAGAVVTVRVRRAPRTVEWPDAAPSGPWTVPRLDRLRLVERTSNTPTPCLHSLTLIPTVSRYPGHSV